MHISCLLQLILFPSSSCCETWLSDSSSWTSTIDLGLARDESMSIGGGGDLNIGHQSDQAVRWPEPIIIKASALPYACSTKKKLKTQKSAVCFQPRLKIEVLSQSHHQNYGQYSDVDLYLWSWHKPYHRPRYTYVCIYTCACVLVSMQILAISCRLD